MIEIVEEEIPEFIDNLEQATMYRRSHQVLLAKLEEAFAGLGLSPSEVADLPRIAYVTYGECIGYWRFLYKVGSVLWDEQNPPGSPTGETAGERAAEDEWNPPAQ